MMNQDQIQYELIHFLKSSILAKDVMIDANMELKTIGVDSFSIVEIILFIERKFGIVLRDDQLLPEHFKTINSIAKLVLSEE